MSGNPWTKFFWSDWETDPALRLCSLAAQGLWMRCLCIAAKSEPTGYVAVNGRPLDATDLARLTGVTEPEVKTLLAELDRNGVFSRDRNGRIYSRRMVRDYKKMQTARKNGKQGGNPTLRKQSIIPPSDNPPVKGRDKPQKPEARSQKIPEPDGSEARCATPVDLKSEIFGPCLRWLAEHTDTTTAKVRPLVGKWCRDYGDAAVLHEMTNAARDGPVDPVAWITRRLGEPRNGRKPTRTVESDRRAILQGLDLVGNGGF